MSLRHLLYGVLSEDAQVVAVYGDRILDAGNLGRDDGHIPALPFLVTRWAEHTVGWGSTESRVVELWSYDNPTDYTRTERGLRAVQDVLHRRAGGWVDAEGQRTWLIEARLNSVSRDLTDDVLRASVKYATYLLVGNSEVLV